MEIFKSINGYVGLYEISNIGSVKSLAKSWVTGQHNTVRIKPEMIMNTCILFGYPGVSLYKDGKQKTFFIHRLIAEHFIENPENKPHVHHKNDNRTDFRIDNLMWVTAKENKFFAYQTGACTPGEGNGRSKLKESEVIAIRNIYKSGKLSQGKIALQYGVSQNCIHRIIYNKTWNHIL